MHIARQVFYNVSNCVNLKKYFKFCLHFINLSVNINSERGGIMMKRITILERKYSKRSEKGGWFSTATDQVILYDMTDLKIKNYLDEQNKRYRTNFYSLTEDFNLKTKQDVNKFIKYVVDNYKNINMYDRDNLKNLASVLILYLGR